jgi:dihydrofolate reductase
LFCNLVVALGYGAIGRAASDPEEEQVGTIVVTEFITVDGVVEDPGGAEGHPHGGWAFDTVRGKGAQFKLDEARGTDALLLGRRTYDGFAQAWPGQEGEFADKFNSIPKYVVSSTLQDPTWNNTTVVGGDLAGEVAELRRRHDGDVAVHGSIQLAQALLDQGLVDELRLMVFPVMLGSGKRLFAGDAGHRPLHLAESRNVGDGVVILTYAKA